MPRTSKPLTLKPITQADVAQFRAWEAALAKTPELQAARNLSDVMCDPLTANAEACWYQIWTKPLYANTKVVIGETYQAKLAPFMEDAWRYIGLDSSRYVVSREGKGVNAEAFSKAGSVLEEIGAISGIAARRLLAIQGGANLLRTLVREDGEAAPFTPYAVAGIGEISKKLPDTLKTMQDLLGFGWGHITVMHMLTDFGLSVKPDLQLVRTARYLDLIDGLPDVAVPNKKQALAIVAMAVSFVQAIYGPDATAQDLRYFDKVLMEASRQKLIPASPRSRG
jgi:hypothetical protein